MCIQNDVIYLKNDVRQLRECNTSILSAVHVLSARFESCIGGINDRLSALSKQISSNDKTVTESIENLNSSTNIIKYTFEQKTNQILNKTNSVMDKLKPQAESVNKTIKQIKSIKQLESKQPNNHKDIPIDTLKPGENNDKQQIAKPKYRNIQIKTKSINLDTNLQKGKGQQRSNTHRDYETIDLTHESKTHASKNHIRQTTLLVGSSLLKGIRNSDLKQNTTVRSFSGAKLDTIGGKLSKYNTEDCKTVVLHIGGNDADNGVDIDTFSENYVSLLNSLSAENRRIIVCGFLTRQSVDLKPYNEIILKNIYDENDNYDSFLLASGEMPHSFFQNDVTFKYFWHEKTTFKY